MSIFRPWNYDSEMLLPPSPRDWLADNHEAFLLADIVRRLTKDDPILNRVQSEGGRPAYHPIMMSIVLIFSYMRGVHSSRRIERLLEENLAYKAISGDQTPDFRTLCRFRKANLGWFELLLKRSIHVGYALGLIDLGAVIIDGTPIQASANKAKSRRLKTLKRMKAEDQELLAAIEAKRLVAQAEALDSEEDGRFGDDGYPRPLLRQKVAMQDRLARIEQAIALAGKAEHVRRTIIRKARARIMRKARPTKRRLKRTGKKGRKLDPEAGRIMARNIREALATADPADKETFDKNLAAFESRLTEAEKRWKVEMAPLKGQAFIPYHESWDYFAEAYGLVIPEPPKSIEEKPGFVPSPRRVEEVARIAKDKNVKLIVTEPYYDVSVAKTIAERLGIPFLNISLYDIGLNPEEKDYISMMDYTIGQFVHAMSGHAG